MKHVFLFLLVLSLSSYSWGKWAVGEINTLEDWVFLTRFCFLSDKGTLRFEFEYPVEYGPQNILLYFDTKDQWPAVYKTDKSCIDKVEVAAIERGQRLRLEPRPLTGSTPVPLPTYIDCAYKTINNQNMVVCDDGRYFKSARERWWYIAISRCQEANYTALPVGIKLKYKIHMTNGAVGDYLHREYSADEFYILPIDIAFLIVYVVLCVLTVVCAVLLRNRQLWHTTYKMYMVSVKLWTFYLFLMCIAYGTYGNDGNGDKLQFIKSFARAFEAISIMVFLLMLILVGKGYTITRGKLSNVSTVKISVFMTLYTITYVVIFIWEAIIFDPGLVLYLYESPPGYALIAMRIIGYLWFCYSIFFTLKHYPEKRTFYYPLFVFYTLWFWAGPIVILVASNAIALWSREKTVVGVENFVSFCGHVFFLILTRPSAANKNFPYHVRTTQIGIMENVPHHMSQGEEGSFTPGVAYAVSNPMMGSSSGPDLTNLFVTSRTKSMSEQGEKSETSFNNNYSNGNGSVHNSQPPEYTTFPSPSAPPPVYMELFQARNSIAE
ncbi:transmembrane protein 145-like isoform X1 [Dreissena polymorpha]|uniref:transmembrane protein 145-like isoform X1 n=1 Tax=Dreissena polymorpha TaxID=45954 RepID=UPI002264CB77|nr:transmembrane protein 145-like isoform X1 [Dreissena polymorpha]